VLEFLKMQTQEAVGEGVLRENIIWDYGIGFGKNLEHNLALLKNTSLFLGGDHRLLVGASRKSFIGELLGQKDADDRKNGSVVVHSYLALQGVDILRVHDVKEAVEMKTLIRALN